jgi:hypothetical protein
MFARSRFRGIHWMLLAVVALSPTAGAAQPDLGPPVATADAGARFAALMASSALSQLITPGKGNGLKCRSRDLAS